MQNSIAIKSNNQDHCLTVYFLDKQGATVHKAQFCNFIGNGDVLARVSTDWIDNGLLPSKEEKGLVFF